MPGQVDPGYVTQRHAAQKGDPCVAWVMQRDLLFKVQPPLSLLGFHTSGNSGAHVNVRHTHFLGQPGRNMLTTGPAGRFVSLLQC